jgi:hypothetical protein
MIPNLGREGGLKSIRIDALTGLRNGKLEEKTLVVFVIEKERTESIIFSPHTTAS